MIPKPKILIADDDAFVRDMIACILEFGGYEIRTSENGHDAFLKYMQEQDISLIVSDMNMPESDGLDLIRRLRKESCDVPIMILTANNEIRIALDAIRSGADDYLLKDENIQDTLLLSVEKVIEKHRLKLENIRLMKELEEKNKELERISFLDGLTGIANRRYFDKIMAEEWERAVRESEPLSLMMIDIDFFKNFNDTYGHLHGDDCLRLVAAALSNATKDFGNRVFRYGGEEFAVILRDSNTTQAMSVGDLIRDYVANLNIAHANSSVSEHLSVSIGIGTVVPSTGHLLSEFVLKTDQALYSAKRDGRNRVIANDC
jgi:diguanylate cyclase (GGDEF)-like protein